MKFNKIIPVAFVAVVIIFSCNKSRLDQPALGQLDEAALANKNGVEGLLIGAYALLDGVSADDDAILGNGGSFYSGASNWIYGSLCGSEAYTGSMGGDQPDIYNIERFLADPNNGAFKEKWIVLYAGVARANAVLRVMRKAQDMTPGDTTEVRAEAVFLRAYYHFEATKIWNKVPFVDETVTYDEGNYHLGNDTAIWPAIENDLKYAMANLPPTQFAIGRANSYAAEAFLAKVYIFQQKYADARPLLNELIEKGQTAGGYRYELKKNYGDNFNIEFKNQGEAVFSVQSSVKDGAIAFGISGYNGNIGDVLNFTYPTGGAAPGGCCGFFQPSQWFVNHFKTDAQTGLPDLDHFNDIDLKNDEGYKADSFFTPYAGTIDSRLDWTVGRRGVSYLDWGPHPGDLWIRDQDRMGPYSPKKSSYYRSQADHFTDAGFWFPGISTANNVNLIRFADILLWAAETEIETGDPDKARVYINRVRERAADPASWVKNEYDIAYAKRVTNSQAEFDLIDDISFTGIQPFDWIVRKDLNQTWVLLRVNADGTKVWNPYSPPNYKVGSYQTSWTDPEFARNALRYERVLELGMEGHRFFDLVRWHIADVEITKYLEKEKIKRTYLDIAVFIKGKNEYFPIPQSEISLSAGTDGIPKMKQNPGYH